MGAFFVEARHISASGEIPAADATLSHVIIDDPHSILYEGLETPTARFYAQSFARGLQGWTGAPLNRVSLRWWGFERDSHGPDAWVTSGYSTLVGWLRSQIDENADARINLGEEVLNIALEDPASDDGEFSSSSSACVVFRLILKHVYRRGLCYCAYAAERCRR